MLLSGLIFMAVVLTCAMFGTKNAMLGFPCTIFWGLVGGQAYTLSVAAWDIYYILAFACLLGMTTFCAVGAYGLREKRDTIADAEMDDEEGEPEKGYIGERDNGSNKLFSTEPAEEEKTNLRTKDLRERARKRREHVGKRWREFKW